MISAGTTLAAVALCALLGWSGPNTALSPHDVIAAVVEALRHNDTPLPNAGIAEVYRFASPANRSVTGPYGHFLRAVRNRPYMPLLKASAVKYGEIHSTASQAWQEVTIFGGNAHYAMFRFEVSRQKDGPCPGCWMVDSVIPLP